MARRSPQGSTEPSWGAPHALGEKRASSRARYPSCDLPGSRRSRTHRWTRVTYAPSMPDLRERWRTSWLEASAYDAVIEHERLARVLGELVWGTDTSAF